jgi:hypothetical protein
MAVITIRLSGYKLAQLQELAHTKDTSVDQLFEQWVNQVIHESTAEMRFRAIAKLGSREIGTKLLDKLDGLRD